MRALAVFVLVLFVAGCATQAERAAAWSEVARRMAHEIKNPLTPIQLSAERIMRNYERDVGARRGRIVRIKAVPPAS